MASRGSSRLRSCVLQWRSKAAFSFSSFIARSRAAVHWPERRQAADFSSQTRRACAGIAGVETPWTPRRIGPQDRRAAASMSTWASTSWKRPPRRSFRSIAALALTRWRRRRRSTAPTQPQPSSPPAERPARRRPAEPPRALQKRAALAPAPHGQPAAVAAALSQDAATASARERPASATTLDELREKLAALRRLRPEKRRDATGVRRWRAGRAGDARSAKAPAPTRIASENPSSAAPGNCSTGCSPPSGSTAPKSISPMSCPGARRATARRRRRSWRCACPSCAARSSWSPRIFWCCSAPRRRRPCSSEKEGIMRLRGHWRDYDCDGRTIRALPMLHPAYLCARR